MRAKNSTPRAYLLRHRDGIMEPCVVVYALTAHEARKSYALIDDATYVGVEVERRPDFDRYADKGGPTTSDLFDTHGWWFPCADCHAEMVTREADPGAVVIAENGDRGRVRCGACAAKAVA